MEGVPTKLLGRATLTKRWNKTKTTTTKKTPRSRGLKSSLGSLRNSWGRLVASLGFLCGKWFIGYDFDADYDAESKFAR